MLVKQAGRVLRHIALAAILITASDIAATQTYPSRPIRIIVPLPPGANGDLMPRILGEKLAARWGQPVVIENRPGAAQNLGAELAFRAAPDGYTLLATPQGPLVISQSFFPKLAFDPAAFAPVTIMAKLPYILVANPKVPVSTLQELIAFAKANPGKLNYASPGTGSGPHLAGEMLKLASGIRMTHVPYSGLAPAIADLLAGHTDIMFDNLGNSLPLVQDGKLKGLGVTSDKRIPELPAVPAIAETYPEVQATSWFAIVAPPKTPPAIAERLSQAFAEILRMPEVDKRFRDMSLTPVGGTPEQVAAFFKVETERWRKVIVSGGIKPD